MADLKPCPMCGSQPGGPTRHGGSDERNGYNFTVTIACPSCGLSMSKPSHVGWGGWCDDTGQAERAVTQAWNTRPEEPRA